MTWGGGGGQVLPLQKGVGAEIYCAEAGRVGGGGGGGECPSLSKRGTKRIIVSRGTFCSPLPLPPPRN